MDFSSKSETAGSPIRGILYNIIARSRMKGKKGKAGTLPETICKTVHQYSKGQISAEDMDKLREIAEDYRRVKNEVYDRYGGISSLSKIYPGYTVQNEMTESGLRNRLGLPSVYFYLAIFDALGDIKCQWTRTKAKVSKLLGQNGNFTAEEKHYLRFLLKVNNAFDAVLNRGQAELPEAIRKQYEELAGNVDTAKLNRYLCRQVRKCHVKLHTDAAEGFSIAERAYRYGTQENKSVGKSENANAHQKASKGTRSCVASGSSHGIYISTKENRKRIFVPLTDSNQYKSQLYIKLNTQERSIEIDVPINVAVHTHAGYTNQVGIALGIFTMLTTDGGHSYGVELGKYQTAYADWMREQTGSYNSNRKDNPGRKKYFARKKRYEEQLHSYINHELNRFFREEKPGTVYMVKMPKAQGGGINKKINNSVTMWQRGYIRKRLELKCREHSVELVEVLGKDISRECSNCGSIGRREYGVKAFHGTKASGGDKALQEDEVIREDKSFRGKQVSQENDAFQENKVFQENDTLESKKASQGNDASREEKPFREEEEFQKYFVCGNCGYCVLEKVNTARNVLKRGQAGKTVG